MDNDCDALIDDDDPDCEPGVGADVWLENLKIPKSLQLQANAGGKKRIYIVGDGDTFRQDATVTVSVDPVPELHVAIRPPSSTERVGPGRGSTKFRASIKVACNEPGNFKLNWTATITAAENRDPTNDTVTGETKVHCR
jgi:hypothetical protein